MENSNDQLTGNWRACKNILCIRADHMGDLLMSTPAIAALKKTFGCRITVLTSSMGADITRLVPDIDQVIVADLQWMQQEKDPGPELLQQLISKISSQDFDGCVIFNVYSQNILPAAMIAYMAGIPLRLAYCRENPYHLLSNWVPDPEPYFYIVHQVERDLDLVRMIGAVTKDKSLRIHLPEDCMKTAVLKADQQGIDLSRPYILLHPGVSEKKREYPEKLWINLGRMLHDHLGMHVLLTGSAREKVLTTRIAAGIDQANVRAVAGLFTLQEFAAVIAQAQTLVSVNTGTIHLAAAVHKPLVVLYAQTNPQHVPWLVRHHLLEFSIEEEKRSKNQVIRFVNEQYYRHYVPVPSPDEVLKAVKEILKTKE